MTNLRIFLSKKQVENGFARLITSGEKTSKTLSSKLDRQEILEIDLACYDWLRQVVRTLANKTSMERQLGRALCANEFPTEMAEADRNAC